MKLQNVVLVDGVRSAFSRGGRGQLVATRLDDAADYLVERLRAGDILITLGAGDGNIVGEQVLKRLRL